MSSEILVMVLAASGVFTLVLGLVHLAIPLIMDFDHAIPTASAAPNPLRTVALGPFRYGVLRSDVRGVAWVMSNAASYVLITLGIADLVASTWLATDPGRLLAIWAAGWWLLRAGGQFTLGRRPGDVAIAAWFATLAGIHLVAAIA